MSRMNVRVALQVCIGVLLSIAAGGALPNPNFTKEEIALLPGWCLHTMGFPGQNGTSRYKEYFERYGRDFGAMHHHCWAVVESMRSKGISIFARTGSR